MGIKNRSRFPAKTEKGCNKTTKKKYGKSKRMVSGKLSVNQRGFAFLRPDDGSEDVFILKRNLNGAWHNDKVTVAWQKSIGGKADLGNRREGEVVSITERANANLLGTIYRERNNYYLAPLENKIQNTILIPARLKNGAQIGQRVMAEIIQWPKTSGPAVAKVKEILGDLTDPGLDILEIIAKHHFDTDFSPAVLKEAEAVAKITAQEDENRLDLRGDLLVTIDGKDARDLDDAVSLSIEENGSYRLGVHIADVGHYVPVGSRLDREAYQRGTSVYFPDRVLPMLPKQLSNGVCSLNAGEDRLTLSCIIFLDADGKILKHQIAESIIHVTKRLDYPTVNAALEQDDQKAQVEYQQVLPLLRNMAKLAAILQQKRFARGAIDFHFPETKILMDDNGQVIGLEKRERHTAEGMIEEFMILANEVVASHYHRKKMPFIYRVHEQPDREKCLALNQMLAPFGYQLSLRGETIKPKAFATFLQKTVGKPEEKMVQTLALRSMQHAAYSTLPLGHFGLASKYYSHFTSPIRRYPDLAIHRVIKADLHGDKLDEDRKLVLLERLQDYAMQSSKTERIAEEAEREAVASKICEYMQAKIGEHFIGTIVSVTAYGFYVALENTAEGLVHISKLYDDDYLFIEEKLQLRGLHLGKIYQIGQKVPVILSHVDREQKLIDFILAENDKME